MRLFEWPRTLTRWLFSGLQLAPAVALIAAILLDEGPSGEPRVSAHFFPLVLWLFDDFAWTCVRNSAIFALVVSVASLVLGLGLLCALARLGLWARRVLGAAVLAMVAISPAFVALGLKGLLGEPERWPWPFAAVSGSGSPAAGLESWSGVSLWLMWFWATLPAGAAMVALASAPAFRRLDPAWDEAARLAGAGMFRKVKDLAWPLIRPEAARAAGLVFLLALVEPGAAHVLGLRRTLGFQIVAAALEPAPFPRVAVWALMAGLLGLAGWLVFRWKGGSSILFERTSLSSDRDFGARSRPVSPVLLIALVGVLSAWAVACWLPIFGLIREAFRGRQAGSATSLAGTDGLLDYLGRLSDPVIVQVVRDSALFGLMVASGIILLASALGLERHSRSGAMWWRWLRPVVELPPLVIGTGVLALPWLLGLASRFLREARQSRAADLVAELSAAIDPREHPWTLMACCVALVLLPRFYRNGRMRLAFDRSAAHGDSCHEAAVFAGAGRWQAWILKKPRRARQLLGRFALFWALAATNVAPALLFTMGGEAKTLGPAVVELAAGDGLARSQAAILALAAVCANLAAIAVAHGMRALPSVREIV